MTKRRRTKGTGSVYTRKDGRVVGEYQVNGKTKFIYGRDEDAVRDRLAAYQSETGTRGATPRT